MYLLSYICVLTLLVSTYGENVGVIIVKNQILEKTCKKADRCIQYCSYSVCGVTDQRLLKTDPSVGSNRTHWWGSLKISTRGTLNCFATSMIGSAGCTGVTSTIDVSLAQLNNTVIAPSNDPIQIMEGETLRVSCSVECLPNVTLTWVTPRGDITVQDTLEDKLVVEKILGKDTGVYQCSVWNEPLRLRLTKYFNVSVLCAPRPHDPRVHPDKISFVLGQTIHLKAVFIANPLPAFSWKKNIGGSSHTIENSDRITTSKTANLAEMTITDAMLTDKGLYRVVADNGIGESADLYFTVTLQETTPSTSTPTGEDAEADTEDEMLSMYIGVGAAIGVFVILVVAVAVFICHRRRQIPAKPTSTTEIAPKNKKPKSLKELSMAKRKPPPPPRGGRPEDPRYSTQLGKKRGGAKGRAQEENYEQPDIGGGGLYQQEMYEDLQPTEYYNN